jgi:hypothetical protein
MLTATRSALTVLLAGPIVVELAVEAAELVEAAERVVFTAVADVRVDTVVDRVVEVTVRSVDVTVKAVVDLTIVVVVAMHRQQSERQFTRPGTI